MAVTSAINMITDERHKQIQRYDANHDDQYGNAELAIAAAKIAVRGTGADGINDPHNIDWNCIRPRGNRVRDLVIAAALLVAEIERLQRFQLH